MFNPFTRKPKPAPTTSSFEFESTFEFTDPYDPDSCPTSQSSSLNSSAITSPSSSPFTLPPSRSFTTINTTNTHTTTTEYTLPEENDDDYIDPTTAILRKTVTTVIHLPPAKLLPVLGNRFDDLFIGAIQTTLTPTGAPSPRSTLAHGSPTPLTPSTSLIHRETLSPTTTRLFLITPLSLHKTPAGRPLTTNIELYIQLIQHPATATEPAQILCTPANDSDAKEFYPAKYEELERLRKRAAVSSASPIIKVELSGVITLAPRPFSTTAVTLSLELYVDDQVNAPAASPSLKTLRKQFSIEESTKSLKKINPFSPKAASVKNFEPVLSLSSSLTTSAPSLIKTARLFLQASRREASEENSLTQKEANKLLNHLVAGLTAMRVRYDRSSEVDALLRHHCIHTTVPTSPSNVPQETLLLATSLRFDDDNLTDAEIRIKAAEKHLKLQHHPNPAIAAAAMTTFNASTMDPAVARKYTNAWRRISGTINEPIEYYYSDDAPSDTPFGKAVGIIDASADDVFAWLWCFEAYEHIQRSEKDEYKNVFRRIVEVPSSRSVLLAQLKNMHGMADRVFALWFTWRKEDDGSYVIAFAPVEDSPATKQVEAMEAQIKGDRRATKAVRGHLRGYWRIAPVAPNVCRFTCVGYGHLGGSIPDMILNAIVKRTLSIVHDAQDRFLRNGKVIDAEMRAAFPSPPALATLTDEQKAIFAKCIALEQGSGVMKWQAHKSPSYLVKMMSRYTPSERGEAQSVFGKGTGLIDCSALEAVAWVFNCCSRDRIRVSREAHDPARLEKEITLHDKLFATIRRTQFPLQDREIVLRYLCASDASGGFVVVSQSVDDKVDYGGTYRAVRASSDATMRCTPVEGSEGEQCRITYHQTFSSGEFLPAWVMQKMGLRSLGFIDTMRTLFQRDDEIDVAKLNAMKNLVLDEPQEYTAEEDELVKKVSDSLGAIRDAEFTEYDSPDPMAKMGFNFIDGDDAVTGRASTIVDVPIEECAAWEYDKTSRQNGNGYYVSNAGMPRDVVPENDHNTLYHSTFNFVVLGISPRDFLNRIIWKWSPGKTRMAIVYAEVEDPAFPPAKHFIRGSSESITVYDTLPPIGGTAQTKITWTIRVDMKGAMPKALVNGQGIKTLSYLITARLQFDKSKSIDLASRLATEKSLREDTGAPYSAAEIKLLALGMSYFSFFENHKKKRKVKTPNPAVTNHVLPSMGERGSWGRTETTVRATKWQVLAYLWTIDLKSRWSGADLERRVLETKNAHHTITYQAKRGAVFGGITGRPRDQVNDAIWKEQDDESLVYAALPHTEAHPALAGSQGEARSVRSVRSRDLFPDRKRGRKTKTGGEHRIRSRNTSVVKIKETAPGICRVVYLVNMNLRLLPAFVVDSYLKQNMKTALQIRRYYQEARRMEDYDDEDGKALGIRLMHPEGKIRPLELVREIVERHDGLYQLSKKYEWFLPLLQQIAKGQIARNKSVGTKLECLSVAEAMRIGKNMMPALKSRKTAEAGLYQWKNQNRSMVELFEEYSWVESMMLAVAREVMKTAPWGLMWRVCTGSGLSLLDMLSDIYMVTWYFRTEDEASMAVMLLAMIALNLIMQVFLVIVQNHKKPSKLPKEILIALSGLKPGYDAARVVSGSKEDHQVFEPKLELALAKACEMYAESIPGCLLQIYALLRGGSLGVKKQAIASVVISALTTGFASATLSYDYDTDPSERRKNPAFYGYIPDNGNVRTGLLIIMTLNSAALLLLRCLSAALLANVKSERFLAGWMHPYLATWIVGDMMLYLLLKIGRGDFHYYLPVEGIGEVFVSLFMRVMVKTIADFTGLLHFRHPGELGGLYWSINVAIALVTSFVSVHVYAGQPSSVLDPIVNATANITANNTANSSATAVPLEPQRAYSLVSSLCAGWVLTFGLILLLMKKSYRRSFVSLKKGKSLPLEVFKSYDDHVKARVMSFNRKQWFEIESQVEAWVRDGWWTWQDDKPDWFDEQFVAKIPKSWIPQESTNSSRKERESRSAQLRAKMPRPSFARLKKQAGTTRGAATRKQGGLRSPAKVEAGISN